VETGSGTKRLLSDVVVPASALPEIEFEVRLFKALSSIDADTFDFVGDRTLTRIDRLVDARERANRLHGLWSSVAQPEIVKGPKAKGRLAFLVKRFVRKSSRWYIEPRWVAQREINAELARFASVTVSLIEQLAVDVAQLERERNRTTDTNVRSETGIRK
jgi:hypothetical protein